MTIQESKSSADSYVILTLSEVKGKDLRDSSVVPISSGLPQNDDRVLVTPEMVLAGIGVLTSGL